MRKSECGWCKGAVAGWVGLCFAPICWANGPIQLRCDVTYAGATHSLVATPVNDPYSVPAHDIRGRFRFKAVLVGTPEQVERINIYVHQNASPQPVLVQQAKYLPPFAWPADGTPLPLTGQQHLYAGPMERELIYSCILQRGRP